jgi:hypothetical protein
MEKSNSVKNPIVPDVKLMKDEEGAKVNATVYKQLVGSLMYLTATRPDLMYVYVSLVDLWQIQLKYTYKLQKGCLDT